MFQCNRRIYLEWQVKNCFKKCWWWFFKQLVFPGLRLFSHKKINPGTCRCKMQHHYWESYILWGFTLRYCAWEILTQRRQKKLLWNLSVPENQMFKDGGKTQTAEHGAILTGFKGACSHLISAVIRIIRPQSFFSSPFKKTWRKAALKVTQQMSPSFCLIDYSEEERREVTLFVDLW